MKRQTTQRNYSHVEIVMTGEICMQHELLGTPRDSIKKNVLNTETRQILNTKPRTECHRPRDETKNFEAVQNPTEEWKYRSESIKITTM